MSNYTLENAIVGYLHLTIKSYCPFDRILSVDFDPVFVRLRKFTLRISYSSCQVVKL